MRGTDLGARRCSVGRTVAGFEDAAAFVGRESRRTFSVLIANLQLQRPIDSGSIEADWCAGLLVLPAVREDLLDHEGEDLSIDRRLREPQQPHLAVASHRDLEQRAKIRVA